MPTDLSALPGSLTNLVVFAPAALLVGAWAVVRALLSHASGRFGLGLLLLVPLFEPVVRPWLAVESVAPRPLDVMLPLLAMPLLASYAWASHAQASHARASHAQASHAWRRYAWLGWGLTSLTLGIGLVLAWASLLLQPTASPLHPGAEDAALVRAVGGQPTPWLQPYQAAATELESRLQPGQRILLDDTQLYPVVALMATPGAFLLPHDAAYEVASQCPDGLVDFIALKVPDGPGGAAALSAAWGTRLNDYDVMLDSGGVRVYALARPGATRRCVGLAR